MASSGGSRSEGKRRDSMRKATCSESATPPATWHSLQRNMGACFCVSKQRCISNDRTLGFFDWSRRENCDRFAVWFCGEVVNPAYAPYEQAILEARATISISTSKRSTRSLITVTRLNSPSSTRDSESSFQRGSQEYGKALTNTKFQIAY
jgi:hypothetical protein